MHDEKILGLTTITAGYRISLIKEVKKFLEVKHKKQIGKGDKILYVLLKNEDILIRLA